MSSGPFNLDGADPPSSRDNGAIEPKFNPLGYNLPTRLYNPLATPPSTPKPSASIFLVSRPTALQVRIFLDDITELGRDYGMSEEEKIGMALYYADRDSRLLWKRMIRSADGKGWMKFRDDVLSFYPGAFVDMAEVRRTLETLNNPNPSTSGTMTPTIMAPCWPKGLSVADTRFTGKQGIGDWKEKEESAREAP